MKVQCVSSSRVVAMPFLRVARLTLVALLCASSATAQVLCCGGGGGGGNPHEFFVRSYQGLARCLDYTPELVGSPIFINDCDVAHPIIVEEINAQHDVLLHAGTKVIGARVGNPLTHTTGAPSSPAGPGNAEYQLVLENRLNLAVSHSPIAVDQHFALDGDSIIFAPNRTLVAKVENARGEIGTPVVLGARNIADNEFWDFLPTNGVDHDPTSGFVRVSTWGELLIAIIQINQIAAQNAMQTGSSIGAAWGSVIKIMDTREPIDLTDYPAYLDYGSSAYNSGNIPAASRYLVLPTGVTIRGDRRGTKPGPLLIGNYNNTTKQYLEEQYGQDFDVQADHMFEIQGDWVRITGLRLQGPLPSNFTESTPPDAEGIDTGDKYQANWHPDQFIGTIIDHNDLSRWPSGAIVAYAGHDDGGDIRDGLLPWCPPMDGYVAPVDNLQVVTNFLHDTEWGSGSGSLGYGLNIFGTTALGNTFLTNRHAITAGGGTANTYSAWGNLVLSRTLLSRPQQIFDIHGTRNFGSFYGGYAGNQVEIAWNTFLGSNRDNFDLRGKPCNTVGSLTVDSFHNNVSMHDSENAVRVWSFNATDDGDGTSAASTNVWPLTPSTPMPGDHRLSPKSRFDVIGNHFSAADPTNRLGVGDFDGDGVQDLFLATGAAWYYSPGGKAEWRYLSGGRTDKIQSLLLGDFDGDGRTDVVGKNGNNLMISWGGISDWEKINTTVAPISDLAVGDFNGDGLADIFWADGTNWHVSFGDEMIRSLTTGFPAPFHVVADSSKRVNELRFGHFSICGSGSETDVFGIVAGKWQVSCGANSPWTPLPVSLTDSVDGLIVADFDGDGSADIATLFGVSFEGISVWNWSFSHDAAHGWESHNISAECYLSNRGPAGIGRFSGNSGSDILLWGGDYGNNLCIVPGGILPGGIGDIAQRQSLQDMR